VDPAAAHTVGPRPTPADPVGQRPAPAQAVDSAPHDDPHPGVFPESGPEAAQPRGSRPTLRRLAGLSGWAALLGVIGMAVGIRALVALIAGGAPEWYEPTLIMIGIAGIVITAAAFVTARRGNIPWILLGTASAVLLTSLIITGVALD
jgi:hypothetical protein